MAIRIALASIDGTRIDQHFGSARYWQIYDIDSEGIWLETRKTTVSCQGHCEGGFEHQLKVLNDCQGLFVSKIGEGAATYLAARGIRVFEAVADVDELIAAIIEGNLFREGS